jgi:hypothetical protein
MSAQFVEEHGLKSMTSDMSEQAPQQNEGEHLDFRIGG